jgi:hypothetical protein
LRLSDDGWYSAKVEAIKRADAYTLIIIETRRGNTQACYLIFIRISITITTTTMLNVLYANTVKIPNCVFTYLQYNHCLQRWTMMIVGGGGYDYYYNILWFYYELYTILHMIMMLTTMKGRWRTEVGRRRREDAQYSGKSIINICTYTKYHVYILYSPQNEAWRNVVRGKCSFYYGANVCKHRDRIVVEVWKKSEIQKLCKII